MTVKIIPLTDSGKGVSPAAAAPYGFISPDTFGTGK